MGQLKEQHLFLTVLEAGSLRSRCHPLRCLVRALFLPCRWLPSHCVLEREIAGVPSYKGTDPIVTSSNPLPLPKAPPPNTFHWGLGPQHRNLGGGRTHSVLKPKPQDRETFWAKVFSVCCNASVICSFTFDFGWYPAVPLQT